jgi:hypothetical protein
MSATQSVSAVCFQTDPSSKSRENPQGRSLFEDTKFGEELSDLGSIATDCLGDIRRSRRPEEADRCISDSGHYFGTRTFSDPACVLAERDVTHVVTPILD